MGKGSSAGVGGQDAWYRTRLRRGGGTRAASFSINSKGDSTKWVVASDHGVLRRQDQPFVIDGE